MADNIKEAVEEAVQELSGKEASVEASVIEESIKEGAEEKVTKEGTDETTNAEEDSKVSQSDEEGKPSEEESGASEEPDARTVSGHKLYDSLTGPDGHAALEELAKQFGRKLAPAGQNKAETTEQAEDKTDAITAIFDKHLGEGYEFLSEGMGKAIKEVLLKEVEPRFVQQQQKSDTKVMQDDLSSRIAKDNITGKDKDKIIANANKLAERMPPNHKNQDQLKEYVGDIYVLASRGIKKSQDAARNNARITKNLQDEDAPSVNAATPKVRKRPVNPKQSGMAGIRESVEAAFEGVRFED